MVNGKRRSKKIGVPAGYKKLILYQKAKELVLEVYLDLSLDLAFITQTQHKKIYNLLQETKNLLYGTRKAVRRRIEN